MSIDGSVRVSRHDVDSITNMAMKYKKKQKKGPAADLFVFACVKQSKCPAFNTCESAQCFLFVQVVERTFKLRGFVRANHIKNFLPED